MTPCPACDTLVDPLRSRFVGVRDGKVVAYCSAECAAGRPRATTERAMSPSTGVPVRIPTPPAGVPPLAGPPDGLGGSVDSGPVIEILHEPASGVVTSAPDRRSELRARHPDQIAIAAFWAADRAARAEAAERERSRGPAGDIAGAQDNPAGGSGRDSAEASGRASERAADVAGAARSNPAGGSGRDSAEASGRASGRAADAAGAARSNPAGGSGRDSAEASERVRGLAANVTGVQDHPAEGSGRDPAEASGPAGGLAGAGAGRGRGRGM